MTIRITKARMAIGLIAVVLVAATAAWAADHPFNDVPRVGDPDERFYSEPVQWAWDNGLTTGSPSGSDTFKPIDGVTRGENITFNFRYDQNVVQPALDTLTDDVAANTSSINALLTPIAIAQLDVDGAGDVTVNGSSSVSASYNLTSDRFTMSVDGETLTPSTHLVHVTPIRVNTGDATADRTAQTFFGSGSVQISVWDESAATSVLADVHVSVYRLPADLTIIALDE